MMLDIFMPSIVSVLGRNAPSKVSLIEIQPALSRTPCFMSKTHCLTGVSIYICIHKAIVIGKLLLQIFKTPYLFTINSGIHQPNCGYGSFIVKQLKYPIKYQKFINNAAYAMLYACGSAFPCAPLHSTSKAHGWSTRFGVQLWTGCRA